MHPIKCTDAPAFSQMLQTIGGEVGTAGALEPSKIEEYVNFIDLNREFISEANQKQVSSLCDRIKEIAEHLPANATKERVITLLRKTPTFNKIIGRSDEELKEIGDKWLAIHQSTPENYSQKTTLIEEANLTSNERFKIVELLIKKDRRAPVAIDDFNLDEDQRIRLCYVHANTYSLNDFLDMFKHFKIEGEPRFKAFEIAFNNALKANDGQTYLGLYMDYFSSDWTDEEKFKIAMLFAKVDNYLVRSIKELKLKQKDLEKVFNVFKNSFPKILDTHGLFTLSLKFGLPPSVFSDKIFFHIHGDAFAEDTGFEGEDPFRIFKFMNEFLEKHPLEDPDKDKHIKGLISSGIEINTEIFNASSLKSETKALKLKDFISSKLKDNEPILIPGGWANNTTGHAMYYEIGKQSDGKYFFRAYNRGAGMQYQESVQGEGFFIRDKYLPYLEVGDIEFENLTDVNTLRLLVEYLTEQPENLGLDYNFSDRDVYGVFIPLLKGKRIERDLSLEEVMSPQHSGTCAWKSFSALMKKNLGHVAYKKFKRELKKNTIEKFLSENITKNEFKPNTPLWNLFNKSLEKYARMTNNLHLDGIISSDEFESDLVFIKDISSQIDKKRIEIFREDRQKAYMGDFSVLIPLEKTTVDHHNLILPGETVSSGAPVPLNFGAIEAARLFPLGVTSANLIPELKKIEAAIKTSYDKGDYSDAINGYIELINTFYAITGNSFQDLSRLPIDEKNASDFIVLLSDIHDIYFKSSLAATDRYNYGFERYLAPFATHEFICHAYSMQSDMDREKYPDLSSFTREAWIDSFSNFIIHSYQRKIETPQQYELLESISKIRFDKNNYSLKTSKEKSDIKNSFEINFIKKLLEEKPGLSEKMIEKYPETELLDITERCVFLLNTWDPDLLPPTFIAHRRLALQCNLMNPAKRSFVPSNTAPSELTSMNEPKMRFALELSEVDSQGNRTIGMCKAFEKFSDKARIAENQPVKLIPTSYTKTYYNEGNSFFSGNRENLPFFRMFTTPQIPCLKDRNSHKNAPNEAMIEKTMRMFTENSNWLLSPDRQDACEFLFLRSDSIRTLGVDTQMDAHIPILALYFKRQPGAHEALTKFLVRGFEQSKKIDNIPSMVFFLRLSHLIKQFDSNREGYLDTSNELVNLMNRSDELTANEKVLVENVFLETLDFKNGLKEKLEPYVCRSIAGINLRSLSGIDPAITRHVNGVVRDLQPHLKSIFNDPSKRKKSLDAMVSQMNKGPSDYTWKGEWPMYSTLDDALTVDMSRGIIYTNQGLQTELPLYIRSSFLYKSFLDGSENCFYKCFFDGSENVTEISGVYLIVNGKNESYRLYSEKGVLVLDRLYEENWYRFDDSLNQEIRRKGCYNPISHFKYTFWSGKDNEGIKVLIYDKDNSLRYIEKMYKENLHHLHRLPKKGEAHGDLILMSIPSDSPPFSFLRNLTNEDEIGFWADNQGLVQLIEFEPIKIGFERKEIIDVKTGQKSVRFESQQYPGYYLKEDQGVKFFIENGVKDYLLLENDKKEQKVIIPRRMANELDENSLLKTTKYDAFDFNFDKTRGRQLKGLTAEANLYLAYRMLLLKSSEGYEVAKELLDVSNLPVIKASEDVINLLSAIQGLGKKSELNNPSYLMIPDHDVRGVALRLKAYILSEKIKPDSGSDMFKEMCEYTEKFGNLGTYRLSPDEEAFILSEYPNPKLAKYLEVAESKSSEGLLPVYKPGQSVEGSSIKLSKEDSNVYLPTYEQLIHFYSRSSSELISRPDYGLMFNHLSEVINFIASKNEAEPTKIAPSIEKIETLLHYYKNSNNAYVRALSAVLKELILNPNAYINACRECNKIENPKEKYDYVLKDIVKPALKSYAKKLGQSPFTSSTRGFTKEISDARIRRVRDYAPGSEVKVKSERLFQRETPLSLTEAGCAPPEFIIDDFLVAVPEEDQQLSNNFHYSDLLKGLETHDLGPLNQEVKRLDNDRAHFYRGLEVKQGSTVTTVKEGRVDELLDSLGQRITYQIDELIKIEDAIMQEVQNNPDIAKEMKIIGKTEYTPTFEDLLLRYGQGELKADSPIDQMVHDYLIVALQTQAYLRSKEILADAMETSDAVSRASKLTLAAAELTKENVSEEPEILVLQYLQNMLIRKDQKDDIDRLMSRENGSGLILQKIMGSGKTSVLMTLLALKRADGENLSVMMVPDQLLQTVSMELRDRLGGVFGQRIHAFALNRNDSFTVDNLTRVDRMLQKGIKDKDCIITTPQAMHCLHLKFLEYCHDFEAHKALNSDVPFSGLKEFELVCKIYSTFKNKGLVLMDEVDLQLNCRHDVNFPVGNETSIATPEQELILDLYSVLLENKKIRSLIKYDFKPEIAIGNPGLFSEEMYRDKVLPILSEELSKRIIDKYSLGNTVSQKDLKDWLSRDSSVINSLNIKTENVNTDKEIESVILLAKEELHNFLPLALKKKSDETYGLSKENPNGIAICYKSGKPLEGVLFANPHETANYSLQTLFKNGVPENLVKGRVQDLVAALKEEFDENGVIDESSEVYQIFVNLVGEKYRTRIFKITDTDYPMITKHLNSDPEKQIDFARRYILPQITMHTKKLNSNSQTLVSIFKPENVCGFSGTLADKDTFHDGLRIEPDLGTDSKTIHLLLKIEEAQGAENSVTVVDNGTLEALSKETQKLIDQGVNVRAIIDTGGYLLDTLPEEIPKAFAHTSGVKGVICHNSQNEIMVTKGGKPPVMASQSPTKPDETFTIYRQPYSTGTDIKQAPDAVALVTVGKSIVLRDLLQSVWRMRGLETGQKVRFIVEKDIEKIIRDTLHIEGPLTLPHIIQFSVYNQGTQSADNNFVALKQKLDGVIIAHIMTYLTKDFATDRSVRPEDVLSRYSKAIDAFLIPDSPDNALDMYGGVNEVKDRLEVIEKLIAQCVTKFERLGLDGDIRNELDTIVRKTLEKELLADKLPERSSNDTGQTKEVEKQVEKAAEKEVQKEVQKEVFDEGASRDIEWGAVPWDFSNVSVCREGEPTPDNTAYFYPLGQYLEISGNPLIAEFAKSFDGRVLVSSNFAPIKKSVGNDYIAVPFGVRGKSVWYLTLVKDKEGRDCIAIIDQDDSTEFVRAGAPIFMINSPSNPDKWVKYPASKREPTQVLDLKVPDQEDLVTQVKIFSGVLPKTVKDKAAYSKWLKGKDPEELKTLFLEGIWRNESNKDLYWKRLQKLL
jgi:hypothetical protein